MHPEPSRLALRKSVLQSGRQKTITINPCVIYITDLYS
jgi:hypothetical protein